jgi:hypothetical protein
MAGKLNFTGLFCINGGEINKMSNYTTLQQPTFLSPHDIAVDMTLPQNFDFVMNGSQADSYDLTIKDENNNLLYNSGNDISIPNTDASIQYSGTFTTNNNQNIDDTNSSIAYFGYGWRGLSNSTNIFYNNTYHQSSTANDYFTYTFIGTGINCYFTEGKDKGTFQVLIDGEDKGTIDTYTGTGTGTGQNNFQVLAYTNTSLALGSHTIKILVTGNKNGSSTSSLIEFDYFQVLNASGSKNSAITGNYIQYAFSSNGIKVYANNTPDAGIVDILLDGKDMGNIDLYSADYNLNTLVYTNLNLTSGSHTIKMVVTGNKNSQSTGATIYFDSLETVSKTALANMLYDKQTGSIILPANTVTQKGALKWQLSLWNSSNGGEMVSSGEMIFTNMTTPTVNFNPTTPVTTKSISFAPTFTQAEGIQAKRYNYVLYAKNYSIYCGKVGDNVTGYSVKCGRVGDIPSGGIHINCGKI